MSESRAVRLPNPCLVVLVGPSGSGKTTWAEQTFRRSQVVSSDALRALVGEDEDDQRAGTDAFAVLDDVLARRLARRLTTVVDTLGLEVGRRRGWVDAARSAGIPVFAVAFATSAAVCRERNRQRRRPVPVKVLDGQLRRFRDQVAGLRDEGFDDVIEPDDDVAAVPAALTQSPIAAARQRTSPTGLAFGLQVPDFGAVGDAATLGDGLAAIGRAADEAGFESLWVMDHLVQIPFVGPVWLDMLESYTTLGFLAGCTERVRLGTMVTGITYRNIAHLGKIVATLDVVSGGRAECGLGAAWFAQEHKAYGYRFPPVAERFELLEDALRVLPMLWGRGSPAFEGHRVKLPETTCYPRPLQDHIPILVGGGGERRTLRLVAEHADACNIIGDHDTVARKAAVLHRHCADLGRDPAEVRITQLGTALVASDRRELDSLVDAHRGNASTDAFAAKVNAGTIDDHIGRFRLLAEAGAGLAVVSLPDVSPHSIARFGQIITAFN